MRKDEIFFLLIFSILSFGAQAQCYRFEIDLNKIIDDKLSVSCLLPKLEQPEAIYYMPSVVPGTYSVSNFGRFVSDFRAFDNHGESIEVVRESVNSWRIKNASTLEKITYKVEDTWDSQQNNPIFEPAGSNFEQNQIFCINPYAIFGYIDGYKRLPYQITYTKPEGFYGSTSLKPTLQTATKDVFDVENYLLLADSPILYSLPDTTTLNVGGAEILVSVYSPNKKITSKFIAKEISDILSAQKEYLGGKLPISKYAFLFYFDNNRSRSGMIGALEHSYSSFYYLQESQENNQLSQTIKDVAAHEFFHIITPLSIHSEEIHDFDFISPKMSKHLWLYEGVTEYAATHVQVLYGLLSPQQYLKVLSAKITASASYQKNLPFTELSRHCLDRYKDQYGNVYEKGALIAACLDIRLRELSQGRYTLQKLIQDLATYYGKDKPFKDDELFDKIAEISGLPQIREFFSKYVEGSEELPYQHFFSKVGIEYTPAKPIKYLNFGQVDIEALPQGPTITRIADPNDKTTKNIACLPGDIIIEINGVKATNSNFRELMILSNENQKTTKNTFKVLRNGKTVLLNLPKKSIERKVKDYVAFMTSPDKAQLELRKAWIGY